MGSFQSIIGSSLPIDLHPCLYELSKVSSTSRVRYFDLDYWNVGINFISMITAFCGKAQL